MLISAIEQPLATLLFVPGTTQDFHGYTKAVIKLSSASTSPKQLVLATFLSDTNSATRKETDRIA